MMKLVNGDELVGTVPDQNKAYFFGTGKRFTEEEYKRFIIDSYAYFAKYDAYTKENIEETEVKSLLSKYVINGQNANTIYYSSPVYVYEAPDGNGYTYADINGRHRFCVAQKYNLKLLVNVIERPEYHPTNQKKDGYLMRIINFFKRC